MRIGRADDAVGRLFFCPPMKSSVEVIKPRGRFDRMLHRIEQQRIFEHTPEAVDKNIEIAGRMMELADRARAEIERRDTAIRVELECLKAASALLIELFIDRTIPTLQRVDHKAVIAMLPSSPEEAAADGDDPAVRERAALREALKRFCWAGAPRISAGNGETH